MSSLQLKDDIKIWYDKYFIVAPGKFFETTGFVSFLLHQFFNGIAHILLKQEIITKWVTEQSYYFIAANNFQRLF